MLRINYRYAIFILPILLIQSCARPHFRSDYQEASKLIAETKKLKKIPFLKAHLKNGDVCILKDSWKIDNISNRLNGVGIQYDYNRNKKKEGAISIPMDSISVYETNIKFNSSEPGRIAGLIVLEALNLYLFSVLPRFF